MTRALALFLAALAILAGAAVSGWAWRGDRAEAELAKLSKKKEAELAELRQQHAAALLAAVNDARADERRHAKTMREALDAEFLARTAAESDGRRAAAAAAGLRGELAATSARIASLDWELAASREAAASTVAMLGELFGQCVERRRELAIYADQAASAGRLCERAADSMTRNLGGATGDSSGDSLGSEGAKGEPSPGSRPLWPP